jgi:lipid A 4'-phosphatase
MNFSEGVEIPLSSKIITLQFAFLARASAKKCTKSSYRVRNIIISGYMFKNYKQWWVPIVLMAMITPYTTMLDLEFARAFYHPGDSSASGHFTSNAFFDFMYNYGVIPAQITVSLALLVLLLSYVSSYWKPWRSSALMMVLTLAIGAGFITHVLLKDHWGRPRPRQVIEFGGKQPFRPYYEPNFFHQPEPSKSFSCGHCSMGFYFFALALLGKRWRNRFVYWISMSIAFTLGIALSITRIAQGGHFFSDVLMTGLIMWLTALTCDWLIFSEQESAV